MVKAQSRRNFLRTAPLAAAVSFSLSDKVLHAISAPEGAGQRAATSVPFQLFSAQEIGDEAKALQTTPGNKNLVDSKQLPFTIVLTTETAKSAKEFEWHEGRDHVLQILDGTTIYEIGGTPKNGRNTKPGEWLAPESTGCTTLTLKTGDMLVIPRGTPHKRSTPESVTFMLISPTGSVNA